MSLSKPLNLEVMGCHFSVDCRDSTSPGIIAACYSAFLTGQAEPGGVATHYRILGADSGWRLECEGDVIDCATLADLIYDFEKDMTVRVQLQRPDLLFIHGAVVAKDDRCVIIAGESGAGKSTLCWTLCNAGFEYLSDELAPVEPGAGIVQPYPHALCLKSRPTFMRELSPRVVDAERTLHIPLSDIPGPHALSATKLAAIVFIDKTVDIKRGALPQEIGAAEAAARLYANSLNQLAHEREGLGAVSRIASDTPAWSLQRAEPAAMVNAIRQIFRHRPQHA